MLVESTSTSQAGVAGAIRQAAGATGAKFEYLLATAQVESGLNPTRKAATSSATGLFQFIDQTWLATVKDAGPALGYGRYADAITRTKSGRMIVRDPAMRAEIMGLRKDPAANALMAGAFTNQNAARLRAKIGREATDGELYMAHFLGASGAAKLINAAGSNPERRATDLFPRAARANNRIFFDGQGHARSAGQVYAALNKKLEAARAKAPAAEVAAASAPPPANPVAVIAPATAAISAVSRAAATPSSAAVSPSSAAVMHFAAPDAIAVRTTRILPPDVAAPADARPQSVPVPLERAAATLPESAASPMFLDLFRTDTRQGVSSAVSALWGTPPRADAVPPTPIPISETGAIAQTRRAPVAPFDLFSTGHPQRPRFDRSS
jgi:Transglycosylase SLT domain